MKKNDKMVRINDNSHQILRDISYITRLNYTDITNKALQKYYEYLTSGASSDKETLVCMSPSDLKPYNAHSFIHKASLERISDYSNVMPHNVKGVHIYDRTIIDRKYGATFIDELLGDKKFKDLKGCMELGDLQGIYSIISELKPLSNTSEALHWLFESDECKWLNLFFDILAPLFPSLIEDNLHTIAVGSYITKDIVYNGGFDMLPYMLLKCTNNGRSLLVVLAE